MEKYVENRVKSTCENSECIVYIQYGVLNCLGFGWNRVGWA